MTWTEHPMFDLHPSYVEVQAAKTVFLRWLAAHEDVIALPENDPQHMSRHVAMSCALAEVWRQGRKYQRDQDRAALLELSGFGKGAAI